MNVRVTIYETHIGPAFVPYADPYAVRGYLIVPAGSTFDDELRLVVPGDPHPYSITEVGTPADAHFRGFGWISVESMAA